VVSYISGIEGLNGSDSSFRDQLVAASVPAARIALGINFLFGMPAAQRRTDCREPAARFAPEPLSACFRKLFSVVRRRRFKPDHAEALRPRRASIPRRGATLSAAAGETHCRSIIRRAATSRQRATRALLRALSRSGDESWARWTDGCAGVHIAMVASRIPSGGSFI
jgi:hypothetical protein